MRRRHQARGKRQEYLAAALARRECTLIRTFSRSIRRRDQRGFTLIEVMISIFLVLLLIVGINQAFKVVSQTVGAGQSLSSKARDSFTVQSALTQEIGRALVHDDTAPFLIIASRMSPAFRNKA